MRLSDNSGALVAFRLKPALDWARAGPEYVEGPEATRPESDDFT